MSVQLTLVVVGWFSGCWLMWRAPRLRPSRAGSEPATGCTVVVPARNEEENLASLLGDLHRQDVPALQIVVVDDESTDATAAVARRLPDVVVVAGHPPPPGWAGKPWACAQGVERATETTLVFLDADVRLRPRALAAVLAEQRRAGGLFSVLPYHDVRRLHERLSAPFNLVSLMGVGAASPGRAGRSSGAFGPCLVCRRDDYERAGGHEAVRAAVVEDLALAESFARRGLPVTAAVGADLVAFRMYPTGVRQLVEGWSKNMATGARSVSIARALGVAVWVTAMLSSAALAVGAVVERTPLASAVGAGAYLAFVVQQRVQLSPLGRFGWGTALAYPLTSTFFVLVCVRSAWLTLVRRRVAWKGRTVAAGTRRSARRPAPEA